MIEETKLLYSPEEVSHPGTTLLDILQDRGMTPEDLAKNIQYPVRTIKKIIKGHGRITSRMASQLERVLGTPAEFWNQREANYRAYILRVKIRSPLEST